VDYFAGQYKRMFQENPDDYIQNLDKQVKNTGERGVDLGF
jgi:hypothetical protein